MPDVRLTSMGAETLISHRGSEAQRRAGYTNSKFRVRFQPFTGGQPLLGYVRSNENFKRSLVTEKVHLFRKKTR